MQRITKISGNIVDLVAQKIFPGTIHINNGMITSIDRQGAANRLPPTAYQSYILPGFIDAHIHIESTMLPPAEFARLAVAHGTVATVSDPHEIANVLGTRGVEYMIDDGHRVPFTFIWGAPSCVPATPFETSGAAIDARGVRKLLNNRAIKYLSEVMNYPGVIHREPRVMEKIAAAFDAGKPIDGHAPGVRGKDLERYISAGISTDHESFLLAEAKEKLSLGMKIIIREGSAAKNFEALHPILANHWEMCMFGSDDKHPNDLVHGHIDAIVRRAVSAGYDPLHILCCSSLHPIAHYGMEVGCLQIGDRADFIEVNNLKEFRVLQTVIAGIVVAQNGKSRLSRKHAAILNNFLAQQKVPGDFAYWSQSLTGSKTVRKQTRRLDTSETYGPGQASALPKHQRETRSEGSYGLRRQETHSDKRLKIRVIEALDGQLITNEVHANLPVIPTQSGSERSIRLYAGQASMTNINSDPKRDILKIAVIRRYPSLSEHDIAIGFIKGFGLKHGAIASTVAHDSHNIVAVGTTDQDMCRAVNLLIRARGGISAVGEGVEEILPLPIAGLMSNQDGYDVARAYTKLDRSAKELGSTLAAPFMTLSFMALPVIPHLKMTDRGLFDVDRFRHVELFSKQ